MRSTSRRTSAGNSTDHTWVKLFQPGAIGLARCDLTATQLRLMLSLIGTLDRSSVVRHYTNKGAARELVLAESTTSEALTALVDRGLVSRLREDGRLTLRVNPWVAWVGDGDARARERQDWDAPFV